MNEQELKVEGKKLTIGEDLYGVSVEQLKHRTLILQAELARIGLAIQKKAGELSAAEGFFNKS